MTVIRTRPEISTEFRNVKYILTSSMRTMLLLAIYENSKNLDDLRKDLKKPSATILHGLKELETENLIKKVQKYYELTSNGYLLTTNMIKLIENWYAINKGKSFWDNHDISNIPEELIKNIYLLKDATYVNSTTSDLSNAYNKYKKLISDASELKMILPIYSENHFKLLIKLLKGKQLESLELIVSKRILQSIKKNNYFNKGLIKNEKVKITVVEKNLKVFLTCSDKFISLSLFFKDNHYDDSHILIGKDDKALDWASTLYNYYMG
ncbi:helix-turn-helix transcriptional regulator [Methanobrevibacter sp.]|uniref:helix-turn-helix transcriptional regulator n=1 Tax=Methanobrevibacter sp. TaxID=66852 RepID=UPI00388D1F0B